MTASVRAAISPINNSIGWSASSQQLFGLVRGSTFRSVFNNTDKNAYIYFSASAATATTACTRRLVPGETYVFETPVYNNVVNIIGEAAGTGSYNTVEYAA